MKKNTRICASTGAWFDPAKKRIGIKIPSDMLVGFGERRLVPLATTPHNGVRFRYGVAHGYVGAPLASSESLQKYADILCAENAGAYEHQVVPFQIRSADLASDAATLRCMAAIENAVKIQKEVSPTCRGIVSFYSETVPGFEMNGLDEDNYASSRLIFVCKKLARDGVVAAFVPRYPDDLLNQRESEMRFFSEVIERVASRISDLRIMIHQVCTKEGVEWVIKNAYDTSSDGRPRIIASLTPTDMNIPYDMNDSTLTDYQRQLCFDAVCVRHSAFAWSECFCLGSGSMPAIDGGGSLSKTSGVFRAPFVINMLLEHAFDVHRLPRVPTTSSPISEAEIKTANDLCRSRLDELHRFMSETGPSFLGLPTEASGELVFERGDCWSSIPAQE